MANKEAPAPSEDGLAGLGLEHQMKPDEAPPGPPTAVVIVIVTAQIHRKGN